MPQTSQVQVTQQQSMLPQIMQLLSMIPGPQQPFVAAGAGAAGALGHPPMAQNVPGKGNNAGAQTQPGQQPPMQPPVPAPTQQGNAAQGTQQALQSAQLNQILSQSPYGQQLLGSGQGSQGGSGFDQAHYKMMQQAGQHLGGLYSIGSQMGMLPSLFGPPTQ